MTLEGWKGVVEVIELFEKSEKAATAAEQTALREAARKAAVEAARRVPDAEVRALLTRFASQRGAAALPVVGTALMVAHATKDVYQIVSTSQAAVGAEREAVATVANAVENLAERTGALKDRLDELLKQLDDAQTKGERFSKEELDAIRSLVKGALGELDKYQKDAEWYIKHHVEGGRDFPEQVTGTLTERIRAREALKKVQENVRSAKVTAGIETADPSMPTVDMGIESRLRRLAPKERSPEEEFREAQREWVRSQTPEARKRYETAFKAYQEYLKAEASASGDGAQSYSYKNDGGDQVTVSVRGDGTVCTDCANGTKTVHKPDGSSASVNDPSGYAPIVVTREADGARTTAFPNSKVVTVHTDGDETTVEPTGVKLEVRGNGTVVRTDPGQAPVNGLTLPEAIKRGHLTNVRIVSTGQNVGAVAVLHCVSDGAVSLVHVAESTVDPKDPENQQRRTKGATGDTSISGETKIPLSGTCAKDPDKPPTTSGDTSDRLTPVAVDDPTRYVPDVVETLVDADVISASLIGNRENTVQTVEQVERWLDTGSTRSQVEEFLMPRMPTTADAGEKRQKAKETVDAAERVLPVSKNLGKQHKDKMPDIPPTFAARVSEPYATPVSASVPTSFAGLAPTVQEEKKAPPKQDTRKDKLIEEAKKKEVEAGQKENEAKKLEESAEEKEKKGDRRGAAKDREDAGRKREDARKAYKEAEAKRRAAGDTSGADTDRRFADREGGKATDNYRRAGEHHGDRFQGTGDKGARSSAQRNFQSAAKLEEEMGRDAASRGARMEGTDRKAAAEAYRDASRHYENAGTDHKNGRLWSQQGSETPERNAFKQSEQLNNRANQLDSPR